MTETATPWLSTVHDLVRETVARWLRDDRTPPGVKMVAGCKPDVLVDYITRAIMVAKAEATAAERERCAKVAETFRNKDWIEHDIKAGIFPKKSEAGIAIAAAIRRGEA